MRLFRIKSIIASFKTGFVINSFWGVFSNILQNIFFSLFFVIIARKYNASDFSSYILANTIYGLVLAFSSLGLGQWFIRKLLEEVDKEVLIHQFFKLQFIIGIFFYFINILLAFLLYNDHLIRQLTMLIGINIIFDNIIYVIKYINIAQLDQKKTFIIQTIESFIKLMIGFVVIYIPVSIVTLTFFIITLRFMTLNVYLNAGTSFSLSPKNILKAKIDFKIFREIVFNNWSFIVIGSISVLFWKMGNILISNYLTMLDVAHYEISFKLFSIAEILPVIVSSSVFPILLKKIQYDKVDAMKFYNKIFFIYALYGLLAYTCIFSFSDQMIPWLFGAKYIVTANYCKEMFLTMLVFPTAILQANLLIALHQEKIDMWLNIIILILNIILSFIGLYYMQSITVINLSILISFIVFHLLQDFILIKRDLITLKSSILFYILILLCLLFYFLIVKIFYPIPGFILFWIILSILFFYYMIKFKSNTNITTIAIKH